MFHANLALNSNQAYQRIKVKKESRMNFKTLPKSLELYIEFFTYK